MSTHADIVYCDYIHCHLIIAPADPSQVNFLKANYHGACFIKERREQEAAKKPPANNPRPTFVTAALLALLFVISMNASAEDVRGCIATYNSGNGAFLFEPFIKVADKEAPSEDGEPEVWGFNPWNLGEPDENGKVYPVNVLASRFIPLNVFKEVPAGTAKRRVRCPPYWQ